MATYYVWDADSALWVTTSSAGLASSPLTTKGDVWGYSTTDARIPVGADGDVLTADSTQSLGVKWAAGGGSGVTSLDSITGAVSLVAGSNVTITDNTPSAGDITIAASGGGGGEIGYAEITSSVTIASTTEAAGTTIVSPGPLTFDGSAVVCTFSCDSVVVSPSSGGTEHICLFEGSTEITRLGDFALAAGNLTPLYAQYRFTPTAGSHTYTITAFGTFNDGIVQAGSGGTGGHCPAFVRFAYA